jgi:hypothetical protein
MRRLLTALPALALLAGCGLLYAEVEIPRTDITLANQSFPATPAAVPLVKDVPFHIGSQLTILEEKNVSYQLRLTHLQVQLATTSPMGDFGDIESVTLSVLPPPGQTLPEATVIASYTKDPLAADQHPRSISVEAMSSLDLAPYIVSGDLTLRFQARSVTAGSLPAWSADVTAEFYVLVHFDYGKLL